MAGPLLDFNSAASEAAAVDTMNEPTVHFDALIESAYRTFSPLAARDPGGWRGAALGDQRTRALLGASASAFLSWAAVHRRWGPVVAACAGEVCAKPAEAAVHVLVAIVEDLIDARGGGGRA